MEELRRKRCFGLQKEWDTHLRSMKRIQPGRLTFSRFVNMSIHDPLFSRSSLSFLFYFKRQIDFISISSTSPSISQKKEKKTNRIERERTLLKTMTGRKILLLSCLSSFVLSSAREDAAFAMSRCRSVLVILSDRSRPKKKKGGLVGEGKGGSKTKEKKRTGLISQFTQCASSRLFRFSGNS